MPTCRPACSRTKRCAGRLLTQLAGELIFERSSMQVKGRQAPSWVAANAPDQGGGADSQPGSHRGGVNAEARGPLSEMLGLMATSPLARMTGNALAQASGTGNADLQLRLSLPISEMTNQGAGAA